jgi:magnesium transporter
MRAAFEHHPEDVISEMERAPLAEVAALVETHPDAPWGRLFEALSPERAARLIETLPIELGAGIVESMPSTRAAPLAGRLARERRQELIERLSSQHGSEIQALLSFPADTAGRIMDLRAMAFSRSTRAEDVLERIRTTTWPRVFDVFVVDEGGFLVGVVPLQELAVGAPGAELGAIMRAPRAFVQATANTEEVVDTLEKTRVPVLPVVDFEGKLLGVIRYEALIKAAEREASADIQTMVGVSKEERALSRVSFAVKKRLPWLEINLGTAFLAASVVGIFESTIAQFTALAVLLPVVAGQSGNTGAQALAVTMRGLALREISIRSWLRVIRKEVTVGALNGVAVALTTSFFVFLWSRSVGLALVIGLSMVISMAIAGLAGGAIPVVLTSLGQDPAQSSSIILTTVTDVVGFFSFLGIATLLSSML